VSSGNPWRHRRMGRISFSGAFIKKPPGLAVQAGGGDFLSRLAGRAHPPGAVGAASPRGPIPAV